MQRKYKNINFRIELIKISDSIFGIIKDNPLFHGIERDSYERLTKCIDAKIKKYKKDDYVIMSGDRIESIGLVVRGRLKIMKEDIDGNTLILAEFGAPELFGEVFACVGIKHSPVTVQASEECEILFINYRKIVTVCSSACEFHSGLLQNMLKLLAKKNLMLNRKIDILSKRTTREKLLAFFETERGMAKKFTIPYSREELARYLCVDRSAMSNELCKMRDDGLIKFNKNNFEIL